MTEIKPSNICSCGRMYVHSPLHPLHLLDNVERGVHDKLIQIVAVLAEAGDAVAALLGRAKGVLEQRRVLGADDGK